MKDKYKPTLAGIAIGVGCTANLCAGGGPLGAFLFSVGLLVIISRGWHLFTGKVSAWDGTGESTAGLLAMWLGNTVSAYGMGLVVRGVKPELIERATEMCAGKLAEGWRVVPLGMLCNAMIYLAVKCGREVITVLCVMVFVLCGFEHCVANAYYFGLAGRMSVHVIMYLTANMLSNAIGGVLMARMEGGE